MTDPMPLLIHDPRPARPAPGSAAAPRLDGLDGVSFALVHNGKTHGMELMHLILDELRVRWALGPVLQVGPPSPGYGGDPDDAGPAAEAAMAALSAVGD
jgi:hypothetical protein